MDKTVTKIVARLIDTAGSNLLVASACALASWTRTNITARHSMQYAADRKVAMLPAKAAAKIYPLQDCTQLHGDMTIDLSQ